MMQVQVDMMVQQKKNGYQNDVVAYMMTTTMMRAMLLTVRYVRAITKKNVNDNGRRSRCSSSVIIMMDMNGVNVVDNCQEDTTMAFIMNMMAATALLMMMIVKMMLMMMARVVMRQVLTVLPRVTCSVTLKEPET